VFRGAGPANAASLLRRYRPGTILLDAAPSPVQALALLPTIRRLSRASKVILIGASSTPTAFLLEALRRGACGHLASRDLRRWLATAVSTVARGEAWVSRHLASAIVAEMRRQLAPAHTTPRLRLIRGRGERGTSSRRHRSTHRRGTAPALTKECHE
jgi:DNA-binding NarL/FixJ family response regulator